MSPKPRVRQYRTVSQRTARAFVFLVVLSFLVAGASSWFAVRAVQGEIASRASVVQLCQSGNDSRAQQITLWTHLAAISTPPPHETPAQEQRRLALVRQLLGYVRKIFQARDCTARYGG